jgi:hypothetical protein
MIPACKSYLTTVLTSAGVTTVYAKQEDAARHKGAQYALMLVDDRADMSYDGSKVGKVDDLETMQRTYHIRRYQMTVGITVRIAARDDTAAYNLMSFFLGAVGRQFDDGAGYAIEVTPAGEIRPITDKSIITTGAAYEVELNFSGGIYVTREVPLIGIVEPEGEIVEEV